MASKSQQVKGKNNFEVKLIRNEVKHPKFKANPKVAYKNDPTGTLSMIPPKVIKIQDVRKS